MGKRLKAKATPVTFMKLAAALEKSWRKRLGKKPSKKSLAVLLAQSALETGHWKYSYCYNLGNAKAGSSWDGDYCFYPADEIVSQSQAAQAYATRQARTDGKAGHDVELKQLPSGKVQVTLHPDHPWCRFRAFATLQAGADDYLGLLHQRFVKAWPFVEAGDPEGFVTQLRELGYFTASLERYLPPVLKLFDKYLKALQEQMAPRGSGSIGLELPAAVEDHPTLRQGAKGDWVVELQQRLRKLGYADVPDNGIFDEQTLSAVEVFQLQHVDSRGVALKSDGIVGSKTWWALLNPSGDAQTNQLPAAPVGGLTANRQQLLKLLDAEHAKPVFETPDGSNSSPDIDRYFGKTGIKKKPWCCAFVSWALHEVLGEFPVGGKHHLGVQVMWAEARNLGLETTSPKPGDVFIQIKSKGMGHTGFVVGVSADDQVIYTCEGNCGNRLKYGQRSRDTIHHFIDALRDGQGSDFKRGGNLSFEDLDADNTR